MTSDRSSADAAGQGEGRVSIFRRVLTAQRLARSRASDGQANGQAGAEAEDRPTEREAEALAAAQESVSDVNPPVESDAAALQAELLELRGQLVRLEELERSLATAQRHGAVLESEVAESSAFVSSLRAELDAARESERSALERSRVLEQDLAAALTELTRVPAILVEAKRALSLDREVEELRAAASEAQAQSASATSRAAEAESSAAAAESRSKAAESRAARADERAAASQARIESVQAQSTAAEARATSVEADVARLEASRREMERLHAAELAQVRAQNEAPKVDSGEAQRLSSEVESLRTRVARAEEAVAAALQELGVRPGKSPVTAADVMRAVGPLTLFALGEGTPGWAPVAPEDTLAAAVLTLAQRAADQQRRLDRLGSALDKAAARR